MTRPISRHDERLIHRFLDGELAADEAATLRQRLESEPALRARQQQLEALRAPFAAGRRAGREVAMVATAGFTANVMAAVRQLPPDGKWRREIADDRVVLWWCRRIAIAAAILFGLALAWHSGLFAGQQGPLQATPQEMQREMERLDQAIREQATGAAAGDRTPSVRPASRR